MSLAAAQFPRLLAGLPSEGALDLRSHELLHGGSVGASAPVRGRTRRGGHPLILELERAGLHGHGGAGFPTATKIDAVAAKRSRPVVVVNACEGEPLSRKDSLLMRCLPHLVLDGALAAAAVLGGDRIVIAVEQHARAAAHSVNRAIAERIDLSQRQAPQVAVEPVPRGYLVGQESALLNVLGGGAAKPLVTPPYPYERGLKGHPTLVCNAETYAHVGLIARYGADWHRVLGTESAPGTRLITIGGSVSHPGVVEVAGGTSLRRLVEASGGLTEPLQGVLLGGYAGTWLGPESLELPLDDRALKQRGVRLGAGIVFVLPRSACVVAEVAHAARWLLTQSARQCGPCEHGLAAIAQALTDLTGAGGRRGSYEQIERWCGLVIRRGACSLPDGVAGFVASALHTFRSAFDDHARHGACERCHAARLLPAGPSRKAQPA